MSDEKDASNPSQGVANSRSKGVSWSEYDDERELEDEFEPPADPEDEEDEPVNDVKIDVPVALGSRKNAVEINLDVQPRLTTFGGLFDFQDAGDSLVLEPTDVYTPRAIPSGTGEVLEQAPNSAVLTWDTVSSLIHQINKRVTTGDGRTRYPIRDAIARKLGIRESGMGTQAFWPDIISGLSLIVTEQTKRRQAETKRVLRMGERRSAIHAKVRTLEYVSYRLAGNNADKECVSYTRGGDLLHARLVPQADGKFRVLYHPTLTTGSGLRAELTILDKRFLGELFPESTPPGITTLLGTKFSMFVGHIAGPECSRHGINFDSGHDECRRVAQLPVMCTDVYDRRLGHSTKRSVTALVAQLEGRTNISVNLKVWTSVPNSKPSELSYPLGRVAVPIHADGSLFMCAFQQPERVKNEDGVVIMPSVGIASSDVYSKRLLCSYTLTSQLFAEALVQYASRLRISAEQRSKKPGRRNTVVTVKVGDNGSLFTPVIRAYTRNDLQLLELMILKLKSRPSWATSDEYVVRFTKANLLLQAYFEFIQENSCLPRVVTRGLIANKRSFPPVFESALSGRQREDDTVLPSLVRLCDSVDMVLTLFWCVAPLATWDGYIPQFR